MNQILIVSDEFKGLRLDVYLTEVLDEWTRSQIKKQIDNKGAFINGKQAKYFGAFSYPYATPEPFDVVLLPANPSPATVLLLMIF